MSDMENQEIDKIIERKNSREKIFRKRSLITISILLVGGVLWLYWTNSQVNQMNQKVLELTDTVTYKEQQIKKLNQELSLLNQRLHEADNFKKYKIDISPADRKYYLFTDEINDQLRSVFDDIIKLQNREIKFNVNGKFPAEGFNSPSFITHVLNQNGITDRVEVSASQLIPHFERVSDGYKAGDLLIYESGYCMIYFTNRYTTTGPFVIGMTPSGILALRVDFAREIAHLRPVYK